MLKFQVSNNSNNSLGLKIQMETIKCLLTFVSLTEIMLLGSVLGFLFSFFLLSTRGRRWPAARWGRSCSSSPSAALFKGLSTCSSALGHASHLSDITTPPVPTFWSAFHLDCQWIVFFPNKRLVFVLNQPCTLYLGSAHDKCVHVFDNNR